MRVAGLMCLMAGGAFGQAATAPAFDVASVRPSERPAGRGMGFRRDNIQVSPTSLTMRGVSLKTAIRWAYHVMDYQVSGPDWIGFQRYDIAAKAAAPASEEQLREMLQSLLADRFGLAVHRQKKEESAYVLLVGKNGPKFHESTTEGESSIAAERSKMTVTVQRTPLSQLVDTLSLVLRTPVVDETGLKGRYDITVNAAKYIASDRQPGDPPLDPVALIIIGIQEELGLKLESRKVTLDLVIVDHAEKVPTEN